MHTDMFEQAESKKLSIRKEGERFLKERFGKRKYEGLMEHDRQFYDLIVWLCVLPCEDISSKPHDELTPLEQDFLMGYFCEVCGTRLWRNHRLLRRGVWQCPRCYARYDGSNLKCLH